MKDIQKHLEKLRVQVAECELIRDLATDRRKRELFARLAEHLRGLADQVEQVKATAATIDAFGRNSSDNL